MTIRSFFAVPLKSGQVRRLADHADTLCSFDSNFDNGNRIQWTDSASYHLTLCFLGDISLEQVAALEHQTRQGFENQSLFTVQLSRSSYLQVSPALAVLAAQADPQPELMQLQQQVAALVAKVGIEVEEADFRPHITLGRLSVMADRNAQSVAGATADSSDEPRWPNPDMRIQVDALVLYQSKPDEHGSIYTPLFEIPLTASATRHDEAATASFV
ncbi:MAG: RNA 2',3'-cyclic phosphodiesterase [Motiliproteus sp.]